MERLGALGGAGPSEVLFVCVWCRCKQTTDRALSAQTGPRAERVVEGTTVASKQGKRPAQERVDIDLSIEQSRGPEMEGLDVFLV